jgi:hypothetical protein
MPAPSVPAAALTLEESVGLPPHQAARMRNLLAEKAARKLDALRVYEPLPVQRRFHESLSRLNVLRGSNRGGKTLAAAAEVAWAVTGQHFVPGKYRPEGGRCYLVGKDLAHIGEVMWRKLAKKGAFRIIRDEGTGRFRAYRPWDAADRARAAEARDAPPLIPPRMVRQVAWESKREEIPAKVFLTNGWEISCYSSLGKPPQGSDIDLWWFDEEIVDPAWYPEMVARILDRKGRGLWSATPQAGTEVLYELHERAEREKYAPSPGVREHVILLAENPHISEEDKRALAADLTEEERRVRIGGDFAIISFRVYPEFNMLVHGADLDAVPPSWTRYMVVDPGHQRCAVLFAAVPPDSSRVVAYDELYLSECDARKFALHVSERTQGQQIQAALIDPNMAAHTEVGGGKSVGQQYGEALAERRFHAAETGSSFRYAADDVAAGVMAVHGWLRVGESGRPYFQVVRGRCPNLEDEFRRYVKQRVSGQVIDKPNNRRNNHLMDCLRYLAMYGPRYVAPRPGEANPGPAVRAFRAKQERARGRDGGAFVRLGPGAQGAQGGGASWR